MFYSLNYIYVYCKNYCLKLGSLVIKKKMWIFLSGWNICFIDILCICIIIIFDWIIKKDVYFYLSFGIV